MMLSPVLAHMIGDYVIQSHYMATQKTSKSVPAALHAASYTLPFALITRRWLPLLVIGGTHFVIDRWQLAKHVAWAKNQVAPAAFRPGHTATGYSEQTPDWMAVWLMIALDNTMHLAINAWALNRWSD